MRYIPSCLTGFEICDNVGLLHQQQGAIKHLGRFLSDADIPLCAQKQFANGSDWKFVLEQVLNLKGLGWLYQQAAFLYAMYGIVGLSILWFAIKGPEPFKRRHADDIYKE